jgi:hypothetical protein
MAHKHSAHRAFRRSLIRHKQQRARNAGFNPNNGAQNHKLVTPEGVMDIRGFKEGGGIR